MKTYILRPAIPAIPLKPISESRHAQDASCPDGSWKVLTNEQKARLSMLARKAAESQGLSVKTKDLSEWRQSVSIRACGLRISEATQAQWADLKAAFQMEAGEDGKAFQTQMREGDNKRRIAMHKLTQALAGKGLDVGYAAKICRIQFKCELDQASAKQLWCLFYTVTNRKNAKP